MRSGILINLIVVALCAGAAVAGQPAQVPDGAIQALAVNDPNDPNSTWESTQHFTQRWDAVTLAFRADRESIIPSRTVSVACVVTVTDTSGVIGFCQTPTEVLVLDANDNVIHQTPQDSQRWYWPLRYTKTMQDGAWVSELQPYSFSVSVPLDPNVPCPFLLDKVQWSMFALVTDQLKTADVPFAPSTEWVELAPGLQILVEQATVSEGKYQYRIKVKYNPRKVLYSMGGAIHVSSTEPVPEAVVMKMDILNAQGQSIQELASGGYSFSGGGSFGGSGDEVTGTVSGSGNCNVCGAAATIRYTLALQIGEKEIRFLLENVPVPIIWY
jgi:hypothetical protein